MQSSSASHAPSWNSTPSSARRSRQKASLPATRVVKSARSTVRRALALASSSASDRKSLTAKSFAVAFVSLFKAGTHVIRRRFGHSLLSPPSHHPQALSLAARSQISRTRDQSRHRSTGPAVLNQGATLANITMKELLEAGVHFGHQTKRWNPKMKEYIFGERNGIYIIDLQKTLKMFKEASKFVTDLTSTGKLILFVGTKRQAQDAIAEEATRAGMPYINSRWLGGLLTNWVTVQKSVKRLTELDDMSTDGRYELLTKKEVIKLERERKHLTTNLAGIKTMKRLPDALFVVDSNNEAIAVAEARKLGIPVVADKALSQELDDVQPIATDAHFLGEDGEELAGVIQESAGSAEASVEDVEEDETIDLNAALGGGIRKAPAAADVEAEPTQEAVTA